MSDQTTNNLESTREKGMAHAGAIKILHHPVRYVAKLFHLHYHRKYHNKYRHPKKLFALDLTLIGIIIGILIIGGYFLFFPPSLGQKVTLTAETTDTITSGGLITYTVSYKNNSKKTLSGSNLTIHLPPHFQYLRSFPPDFSPDHNVIFLGDLEPNAFGEVKISGILWAEIETKTALFNTLSFRDEKSGTHDVKVLRQEFPVEKSVLVLEPELPENIIGNQEMTFSVQYSNTGSETLNNVRIKPRWPEGFKFRTSDPKFEFGTWNLGNLKSGAVGRVIITGKMPDYTSGINFGFISSVEIDGHELAQGTTENTPHIIASPLKISASIDTAQNFVVPGEELKVRIDYKNESNLVLKNVTLGIESPSPFIDSNKLNSLIISSENDESLAQIEPGASGNANFTFNLRENISLSQLGEADKNKEFNLMIKPVAKIQEETLGTFSTSGTEIIRPIRTPFKVATSAWYWTPQGEQLGRGPIPPMVGETTKYWIFWSLAPTTNDIKNLEIRTILPPQVSLTDRTSLTDGRLTFDSGTRVLRWAVSDLEATLATGNTVEARFELAITPTADQVGQIPLLVNEIFANAEDVFVNQKIETVGAGLTTALPNDRRVRGRGAVEE